MKTWHVQIRQDPANTWFTIGRYRHRHQARLAARVMRAGGFQVRITRDRITREAARQPCTA